MLQSCHRSMPTQPQVTFRTQYAPTYKMISVNAFVGHTTEKGIELRAYSEEQDFTPLEQPQPNSIYVLRTMETCLIINPMQAKLLHGFLATKIKECEEIYGAVSTAEEVSKKIHEKTQAQVSTSTNLSKKPDICIQQETWFCADWYSNRV